MWHSEWKPAFDDIVGSGPTPADAVACVIAYGEQRGMPTPQVYASTAISSAGWRRDPNLQGSESIPTAIEQNGRTAALILEALVGNSDAFVTGSSMMVPTDLGKVPGWKDVDYLVFYFAWMAGLNSDGTALLSGGLREPQYASSIDRANDRTLTNADRWPSYRLVTEVTITKLRLVESQPNTRAADGADILLQLVDVTESLGCRAERLFADARGLDVIVPTFDAQLPGDLGIDVGALRALGASVGAARNPVELIPIALRR